MRFIKFILFKDWIKFDFDCGIKDIFALLVYQGHVFSLVVTSNVVRVYFKMRRNRWRRANNYTVAFVLRLIHFLKQKLIGIFSFELWDELFIVFD